MSCLATLFVYALLFLHLECMIYVYNFVCVCTAVPAFRVHDICIQEGNYIIRIQSTLDLLLLLLLFATTRSVVKSVKVPVVEVAKRTN